MSQHTRGPLKYQRDGRSDAMMGKKGWNPKDPKQCGHCIYGEHHRVARLPDAVSELRPEAETVDTAILLAAAYTSYDKHCGDRAVECAEADLLGELADVLRALLDTESDCTIERADAVLAKLS